MTENNGNNDDGSAIERSESDNVRNIIDPMLTVVTMDDISIKLSKLLEYSDRNEKILSSILEQTVKSQQRLSDIQQQLSIVKDENIADADEGEYLILRGTVTTTDYTIIDTQINPGYPVRGYIIKNDGPNILLAGHNIVLSGVDPDLVDVTSNITRFFRVLNGEDVKFSYNRNKIRNIYMLGSGGNCSFRIWLIW